jgi:agmatinase
MTLPLTRVPGAVPQTFLRMPFAPDLAQLNADVAILGIPHCSPYHMHEATNDQSRAPDAIRAQSDQFCYGLTHWDFDLDGPLMDGRNVKIVDCGNVPGDPFDIPGNIVRAEQAMRAILARGALPIVFGGDHGATVPALRAYEGKGPITLVHIDAHLDWRDDVNGVKDGYSSPIRRASELPWD